LVAGSGGPREAIDVEDLDHGQSNGPHSVRAVLLLWLGRRRDRQRERRLSEGPPSGRERAQDALGGPLEGAQASVVSASLWARPRGLVGAQYREGNSGAAGAV
jgi:hypothetical protein